MVFPNSNREPNMGLITVMFWQKNSSRSGWGLPVVTRNLTEHIGLVIPKGQESQYKDREDVRAQANSMRNDLKSSNHGVGIQIPKEWRDARRRLYSIMQAERLKGNRVMKKKLYAAFLDWEKMFDKIDRLCLWRKLLKNDVSSKSQL